MQAKGVQDQLETRWDLVLSRFRVRFLDQKRNSSTVFQILPKYLLAEYIKQQNIDKLIYDFKWKTL